MRSWWFAVLALATVSGCGHNIGDSCTVNVDCSIAGDRFCDISSPGGYCTVDGCDVDTCPSEAVCIRFLTPIQDQPCNLMSMSGPPDNGCSIDERCVCDDSIAGQCQNNDAAHCAPESTERRWCQLRCHTDSDCRIGYKCVEPGSNGAEPVPIPLADGGVKTEFIKFCAPNP
ncbi:MAG TPA: hypothetical protein VII38_01700 [Polyangia bacterium]|jgi:hypothetical protein